MSSNQISFTRAAEVCAMLMLGESQAAISRKLSIAQSTVGRAARVLQAKGVNLVMRKPTPPNLERRERLFELLDTTDLSNRAISARIGLHIDEVSRFRRKRDAERLAAGEELPRCDCGQELHHPRLCWVRTRQSMIARGVISIFTMPPETQAEVRAQLLQGDTMRSIADRLSLRKGLVHGFLRTLSDEDRATRNAARHTQAAQRRTAEITKRVTRPQATAALVDPLYAQIAKAVPRGIDPSLRDDMISEAYLAVLEGALDPKKMAAGVKKVRGKVFQAFANPWGDLSIDAPMFEDGSGSLADLIPDERALKAFDAIGA